MWASKPGTLPLSNDQHWCGWCMKALSYRRFDQHITSCKAKNQAQASRSTQALTEISQPHAREDSFDFHMAASPELGQDEETLAGMLCHDCICFQTKG